MTDLFDDLLAQTKAADGEQLLRLGQQVSIAHLEDGTLSGEQFREFNDAWVARMRTLVGPEEVERLESALEDAKYRLMGDDL